MTVFLNLFCEDRPKCRTFSFEDFQPGQKNYCSVIFPMTFFCLLEMSLMTFFFKLCFVRTGPNVVCFLEKISSRAVLGTQ